MKVGDIVEFKREGFVSTPLSYLLKLFEKDWDRWGWHLAIAWEKVDDGWILLEATGNGVCLNWFSDSDLWRRTRSYHWLDEAPSESKKEKFCASHIGKKYDVAIYFWTGIQYLFRHLWNRRIPRLLDDRYTCWELVFEFCEEMGKPIASKYDCPIITDFIKAVYKIGT